MKETPTQDKINQHLFEDIVQLFNNLKELKEKVNITCHQLRHALLVRDSIRDKVTQQDQQIKTLIKDVELLKAKTDPLYCIKPKGENK